VTFAATIVYVTVHFSTLTGQDGQWSNSTGRTVLETVALKTYNTIYPQTFSSRCRKKTEKESDNPDTPVNMKVVIIITDRNTARTKYTDCGATFRTNNQGVTTTVISYTGTTDGSCLDICCLADIRTRASQAASTVSIVNKVVTCHQEHFTTL